MMDTLSERLSAAIKKEMRPDELGALKIDYGMLVLRNELAKLLLLAGVFLLLRQFPAFLFCSLVLLPVRMYSGGLHFNSNIGCFLASVTLYFLSIELLPLVPLSQTVYFLILVLSLLCICLFSPVASENKPIRSQKKYNQCRRMTFLTGILSGILIAVHVNKAMFFHAGVWIIVLQASQMLAAYIRQPVKGGFNR